MNSTASTGPTPRPTAEGPVSRRGVLWDSAIAAALAAMIIANGFLFVQLADAYELATPGPVAFISGAVMCLALAARRVAPVTVFVVVAVAFTVYGFNQGYDGLGSSVALFVACVSVGTHGRAVVRDWARGIVIAGLFGTIFYAFYLADRDGVSVLALWFGQTYTIVLNIFYFAAAWVLGDQLRLRRQREDDLAARTAELSARTRELQAEQERSAEKARTDERLRIARELHDVLGHHVSVMGVQAGAARHVLRSDPAGAEGALQAIESSSRQAVTELQRALRLLRDNGDDTTEGGPEPPGGLSGLERIADEVRRAGVAVTLQTSPLPELPVEVELAAVRVVQESLTNVLRHAGPGSSAWVKVGVRDATLHLEVADDGAGSPIGHLTDLDDAKPTGHRDHGVVRGTGLDGMRERVELHGGSFHAGPVRPRGWRVTATLPAGTDGTGGESQSRSSDEEPAGIGPRP